MELQRFPRLHAQLIAVVSKLLRERLDPSSGYVQSLISIQAAYINTNHPLSVKYRETDARGPESEASQSAHVDPALDKYVGSDENDVRPHSGRQSVSNGGTVRSGRDFVHGCEAIAGGGGGAGRRRKQSSTRLRAIHLGFFFFWWGV
ncbi:unnamed protein product [Tilletia controversa]|nr:unnamed protein product [Tilletia controversa]CAD6963891.1 unnamed protein product [Tilletia controversa]